MHIMITAKAKVGQLYQCTRLIVGDKYTDAGIMAFLGAKLTKDYPEPLGPSTYVLSATPMAVMDALQEKGFELKMSQTIDSYITWIMSKPTEKLEGAASNDTNLQQDVLLEQKPSVCDTCVKKTKELQLQCGECRTKLNKLKGIVLSEVGTQTVGSPIETNTESKYDDSSRNKRPKQKTIQKQSSTDLPHLSSSGSDHSQPEEPPIAKIKAQKHESAKKKKSEQPSDTGSQEVREIPEDDVQTNPQTGSKSISESRKKSVGLRRKVKE